MCGDVDVLKHPLVFGVADLAMGIPCVCIITSKFPGILAELLASAGY